MKKAPCVVYCILLNSIQYVYPYIVISNKKWVLTMNKVRILILVLLSIIFLGGCEIKKSVSTEFFETNANNFECVAEFLNEESPCLEITTDRPPLFSNEKYKKIEKLFYIYDETAPKLEEKYIEDIETLFKKCPLVRILILKDENIVLFQTKSTLGEGEYIVYTKLGNECSDEYIQAKEWISETWYIAKS